jgi:hypothetical protein
MTPLNSIHLKSQLIVTTCWLSDLNSTHVSSTRPNTTVWTHSTQLISCQVNSSHSTELNLTQLITQLNSTHLNWSQVISTKLNELSLTQLIQTRPNKPPLTQFISSQVSSIYFNSTQRYCSQVTKHNHLISTNSPHLNSTQLISTQTQFNANVQLTSSQLNWTQFNFNSLI